MRFLIDQNLSPHLVSQLASAGHEVAHVRSYGLHAAPDTIVLERARREGRILISADTDFGTLLALQRAVSPSVILLRLGNGRRAAQLAAMVLANLGPVREDLEAGAVVVIGDERVRVRQLPLRS